MRTQLKILNLVSGMYLLAAGMLGPIYAVFVQEIGGGTFTAGAAYGVYTIAAGIMIYIMSRIEDRIDHQEKLITFGYALSTIGFLGYLLVQKPVHLFLVQTIIGLAAAIRIPAFDSYYSKNLDKGKFASEWGIWESMSWIVAGISAIVGGAVASLLSFHTLFIAMAIVSFIGVLLSFMLWPDGRKKKDPQQHYFRELLGAQRRRFRAHIFGK